MYTQCPDCGTSFRVTAVVLKQAAGKVRCGGCGNAFNALAYLSEAKPDPSTRTEADGSLPELTPDVVAPDDDVRPTSISPEQSAALLKTLDQLAGEDIRLEDTGVEWRVMDNEEEDDQVPKLDELLEKKPTHVDEFLTKTPTEVEAGEIFEDPVPSIVDEREVFEGADRRAAQTSDEELRFDDNTGLPDDFDFDSVPKKAAAPPPEPAAPPNPENAQADLALGDADEWGELLDEVEPDVVAEEASKEVEEDQAEDEADAEVSSVDLTFEEELDSIDDPPEEEAPLDIDTQFGMQAEAMGIDLSGIHETQDEKTDFPESTVALSDELERAAQAVKDSGEEEATSIDDDLMAAAFEAEKSLEVEEVEEVEAETGAEHFTEIELLDEDAGDDLASQIDGKFDENIEKLEIRLEGEDDAVSSAEHVVPPQTEEEQTLNMMIDQDLLSMAIEDEDGFASTIVMEGKNVEGKALETKKEKPKKADKAEDIEDVEDIEEVEKLEDTSSGFETIVMEGDFSGNALDKGKLAKTGFVLPKEVPQDEGSKGAPNYGMIAGIVVLVLLLAGQIVHQSRAALATVPAINDAIGPIYRAVGAPINPNWDIAGWRFEVTKGSTNPIGEFLDGETEAPDIEAVDDSEDIIADEDEVLTIFSRVGNQSDSPLPYPLISVALTDRFEEIIGSKVLEPSEYLTGNFDPRIPVPPGNTFNAVISVETPAPEAEGFILSVCYRQAGGLLRCAMENFK